MKEATQKKKKNAEEISHRLVGNILGESNTQ